MVLPLIAAAVAVKVGSKIAKKVAKGAYRVAKSDTVRSAASKAIKSKQARCAAKASIAERGTKRTTYRSCMTGKPAKKRK